MKNIKVPKSTEEYIETIFKLIVDYAEGSAFEKIHFAPKPPEFYNPGDKGTILTDLEIKFQDGGLYLNLPDENGEIGIGKGRSLDYRGQLVIGSKIFWHYSDFKEDFVVLEERATATVEGKSHYWFKINKSSVLKV